MQVQSQLRISLAVIGAHVMPSPPVLVAEAHERFDGHELVPPETDTLLRYALDRFAAFLDVMAGKG